MDIDRRMFTKLALSMGVGTTLGCVVQPQPTTPPPADEYGGAPDGEEDGAVEAGEARGAPADEAMFPTDECVEWSPSGECVRWAGDAPANECVDWSPSGECIAWE